MDQELHKVTKEDLPVLRQWLEKYFPDSFKLYATVSLEESGKWSGTTFYALGWPEILAVSEGPVDPATSLCADYYNNARSVGCFSPQPEHLETLLTRPEFLDWTKPILFHGVSKENADVIQRISNVTGTQYSKRYDCHLVKANPGDIKPIPIPEGFEMRELDADIHSEYIASTWPYRRKNTELYVHALVKSFPSVALFDSNDKLVAFELTSEYRTAVLLYVREETRKRGLGQCVASHLAQRHLEDYGRVMATIVFENKPSLDMHLKLGYKIVCPVAWFLHTTTDEKIMEAN